jgi:hypothetical protein
VSGNPITGGNGMSESIHTNNRVSRKRIGGWERSTSGWGVTSSSGPE